MAEFKNELILQTVDSSGTVTKSVVVDLRNALVLTSAPTTATAARVGMQAYVVSGSTVNSEYVCVAAENGVYTWVRRVVESSGGGTGGGTGADGITPHIGTNGNWFIGDTDTGVQAQGQKGDPGYTPQKGVDYFDGAKGDPGDDYILTEADKTEIAEEAADIVDDALSEVIGDPSGAVPAVPGYMALGMTGAAVGMVARVKSVDADGKPTEWEPVEMGSGGGAGGAVREMVGATADTAGAAGLVPAPAAGDSGKVLFGDGTWGTLPSGGDWTKLEQEFTHEGGESGISGNFKLTPSLLCEEDFVEAFVYVWVNDTAGGKHRINYTATKVDYKSELTVPANGVYLAYHAVKVDNSVIISSLDTQNIHKRFAYTTDVTSLEKSIGFWIHWSTVAAGESITSRGVIVYR